MTVRDGKGQTPTVLYRLLRSLTVPYRPLPSLTVPFQHPCPHMSTASTNAAAFSVSSLSVIFARQLFAIAVSSADQRLRRVGTSCRARASAPIAASYQPRLPYSSGSFYITSTWFVW